MRRNSTLIVIVIVALVVGAGLAAAVGNVTEAAQTESNNGQTITVGASGSAETTPDQAILEVAVVTTGNSAGAVRQQLANNVSRMRSALSDAGVADDQIRTVRYDIRRNHERRQKEEKAPEYRAMHSFRITLNDTDRVGELIDVAVKNGATEVDEVRFGLSTDAQRETRKKALEDAMSNARGQADTLATASNLEVTGVHAVSTVERGYQSQVEHATAVAAGDSGTAVESGPVSVTVEVQVTYNATSV